MLKEFYSFAVLEVLEPLKLLNPLKLFKPLALRAPENELGISNTK